MESRRANGRAWSVYRAGLFAATAATAAVAALTGGGCSSARYDADYARAVADHRTRAEFARLQEQPTELAAGRVKLHPPRFLPDSLSEQANDPRFRVGEDGQGRKINPRRLRPPFLEGFPGFAAACEGIFGPDNGKLPATLSIGAVSSAEMAEAEIAKTLLERVRKDEELEGKDAAWEHREVTDRSGRTRAWQVLQARGPQRIDRFVGPTSDKEPSYDPVEATVAIWLSADKDQEFCTMLVWRVPDEIKESVKLDDYAPLVARSVTILPPPAEPAK